MRLRLSLRETMFALYLATLTFLVTTNLWADHEPEPSPYWGGACSLSMWPDDWVDDYTLDTATSFCDYMCLGIWGTGCEPVMVLSTLYRWDSWAGKYVMVGRTCRTYDPIGCNTAGSFQSQIVDVLLYGDAGSYMLNTGIWSGTCDQPDGSVCYGAHNYFFTAF